MFGFFFSWFIGQWWPIVSHTKTQTLLYLRLPIGSDYKWNDGILILNHLQLHIGDHRKLLLKYSLLSLGCGRSTRWRTTTWPRWWRTGRRPSGISRSPLASTPGTPTRVTTSPSCWGRHRSLRHILWGRPLLSIIIQNSNSSLILLALRSCIIFVQGVPSARAHGSGCIGLDWLRCWFSHHVA